MTESHQQQLAVVAVTGMLCQAVAVAAYSSFVVASFVAVSVAAAIIAAGSDTMELIQYTQHSHLDN